MSDLDLGKITMALRFAAAFEDAGMTFAQMRQVSECPEAVRRAMEVLSLQRETVTLPDGAPVQIETLLAPIARLRHLRSYARMGITTAQLLACLSREQLLLIEGVGPTLAVRIEDRLFAVGLKLSESDVTVTDLREWYSDDLRSVPTGLAILAAGYPLTLARNHDAPVATLGDVQDSPASDGWMNRVLDLVLTGEPQSPYFYL